MKAKCMTKAIILLLSFLVVAVVAKKPLRSIEVSIRGKSYKIRDVTTVSELQQRLFEASGQHGTLEGSVEFRGKKLSTSDILRDVGVRNGAKLTVIPAETPPPRRNMFGPSSFKPRTNNNNKKKKTFREYLDEEASLQKILNVLETMNRDDVSALIRERLEQFYYSLRQAYDDPRVRAVFNDIWSDPDQIEDVRKRLVDDAQFMEAIKNIDGVVSILENPIAFREYCERVFAVMGRASEVILDSMLEIVLDMLRGSASRRADATKSAETPQNLYNFENNDDTLASNVLFELSESEDEEEDI